MSSRYVAAYFSSVAHMQVKHTHKLVPRKKNRSHIRRNESRAAARRSRSESMRRERVLVSAKSIDRDLHVHVVGPSDAVLMQTKPGWEGDRSLSDLADAYASANDIPGIDELKNDHGFTVVGCNGV